MCQLALCCYNSCLWWQTSFERVVWVHGSGGFSPLPTALSLWRCHIRAGASRESTVLTLRPGNKRQWERAGSHNSQWPKCFLPGLTAQRFHYCLNSIPLGTKPLTRGPLATFKNQNTWMRENFPSPRLFFMGGYKKQTSSCTSQLDGTSDFQSWPCKYNVLCDNCQAIKSGETAGWPLRVSVTME